MLSCEDIIKRTSDGAAPCAQAALLEARAAEAAAVEADLWDAAAMAADGGGGGGRGSPGGSAAGDDDSVACDVSLGDMSEVGAVGTTHRNRTSRA